MAQCREKKIRIPGFEVALKIWGPSNAKPVLCLHGMMDNAASFDLIAPLLPKLQLFAVDYPGVGLSSHYPEGILPHWKNDAFLMLHLIEALGWSHFDIIAHSLGSLLGTTLAMAKPNQVDKLIFLDILGPTVNFIEQRNTYLHDDVNDYLTYQEQERVVFPELEQAIQDRVKIGNISYQAAKALVSRRTKRCKDGWVWRFDSRLRCVSSTLPYEDELRAAFKAIKSPVCLIRAKQGVPYPEPIFQGRAESINNLSIYELEGGHHVHMDDPEPVANVVAGFLCDPAVDG